MQPRLARPVHALLRWRGRGWCVALALWWGLLAPASAQSWLFEQARAMPLADGAAPQWSGARQVSLPDDWADSPARPTGSVAYRLEFDAGAHWLEGDSGRMLRALYIERACSGLEVLVNGALAHRSSDLTDSVARHCRQPQLVALPAALLRNGRNTIDLIVRGRALDEVSARQRAGGLSAIEMGPIEPLQHRYLLRMALAVRLPEVLAGTLLLMGGVMVVMGGLIRFKSYLAYFGALLIGWALVQARLWLPGLPWDQGTTEWLLASLMGLIAWVAVQFLVRYAEQRHRWLDIGLPLQAMLMGLTLWLASPGHLYVTAMAWLALLSLEAAAAAGHYLAHARRLQHGKTWPMALLLGVVGVALVAEFVAQRGQLDPRFGDVAQLIPSLVLLALGLRLVQQYGLALESAEQGRAELEVRISEATAQIERNFAQLADLKVEQVTDRERKRIAADLHDDLGAKLLTIVHTSDNERISALAREALEEMRLSVRGLTGKPVRLSDALGDWRAEVISRLAQSGVEGEWSAPADEEVSGTLSARAYVQTTRILREAVSNIIKHSRASRCLVRCAIAEGDFQLVVQDNGSGIPLQPDGRLDKGHGMASMKSRAKQLQGQCLVESGPGRGTVIRLTLPLNRNVTAS